MLFLQVEFIGVVLIMGWILSVVGVIFILLLFFIPCACAHWCPMPPWLLVSIPNGPAPWCWVFAGLSDTILWCRPSTLFSFFLSCLVHVWFQTPRSSNRLSSILQICPNNLRFLSMISCITFCWYLAFVWSLHSLFSVASVCGEFFCKISSQMPSTSLCFSSSASRSHMYIEGRSLRMTL